MASSGALFVLLLVAGTAISCFAQTDITFMGGATSVDGVISGLTARTSAPMLPYRFKYDAVGSGAGVRNLISGQYVIGCGDNAYTAQQEIDAKNAFDSDVGPMGGRGGKFTFPFVVLTFSLFVSSPAVTTSNRLDGPSLSPDAIASIFTDQVSNWNAVKTAAGKPVTVRSTNLKYVVRCDSSGSTKVFQSYLKLYSSVWNSAGIAAGNVWPGLSECASQPSAGTAYKKNGLPSRGSWQCVNSVGNCKATGCITYAQSGYGKGKGFSAAKGERAWILSECKSRNLAKLYTSTKLCNVLQVVPRPFPKPDASWFATDGKLLSAAGAQTCPIVSFNYLFARYNYNVGVAAKSSKRAFIKPTLTFMFTKGQDAAYLTNKAVVKMPTDIITQNTGAVAKIVA